MRCNKLYVEALARYGITESDVSSTPLWSALNELLKDGLVEEQGCLVFRGYASNVARSPWDDQIGREAWSNDLDLSDYDPEPSSLRAQLIQALKLVAEFPRYLPDTQTLDVLVTIGLTDPDFCPPILDDSECLPCCTFRFYQLWPGQDFGDDDLDNYRNEALATFRIAAGN